MRHPRFRGGHAEHLVVATLLIAHPEHPDRPAADQAARKGGLLHQHQRVQRITVLTEAVLDEAVVSGVLGGREQRTVQPDATGPVVHLVLVALPLRDLNRHIELHTPSPSLPRPPPRSASAPTPSVDCPPSSRSG